MRSLVTSIVLYACESWTLTAELQRRIHAMEMRCYPQDTMHLKQRPFYQRGSPCQGPAGNQPTWRLLTTVKRRNLQWYGHVSRLSGLAKTILQGTVKGGRRPGRQRKRWEDNIREWTGLEFGKFQRGKMERTGCKIICGAPTTLLVKGLMMVMMMMLCKKIDLLFWRSGSLQALIWSKYNNFYRIFWIADHFATKLGLIVHYHKL